MRNNKGQAAMEFLMTYGWAILIVVIAVAALAAFGVFNPQRFAQERCVGDSTKFACTSDALSFDVATETLVMEISNGAGSTVNITGISSSADGDCGSVSTWQLDSNGADTAASYRPNEQVLVSITCANDITEGGVFQDTFDIEYDIVDGVPGLEGSIETVVKT
jgi:hypothetical protein